MTTRLASVAIALVLAACAAPGPPPSPPPELAGVPRAFEMDSRISIRVGDRNDIARLRWIRHPRTDEWIFSSPIGTEVARIESGPRGATLERAGAEPETAASFEALTERVLGIALDPAQLSAWLHGQPARPGLPADWKVNVEERQQAGAVQLAKRITATRGDVVLKLVVDAYRPLEE